MMRPRRLSENKHFSQIEVFGKNTHSHIVDISESRASLTGALFY